MSGFKAPTPDRFIIRTDSGPDVAVDQNLRLARVEIVDSKTGKVAGHMALYNHPKNVVIHVVDRRRKAGDNVLAWVFPHPLKVEDVMARAGGGRAIKELLQRCGYEHPEVLIQADDIVVE